ncbi:MAG: hypothetical protein JXA77_09125 [Bacteroidales bacterium]|nr:hypothetical protein [Bacteroidales bacterium]MBN2819603.1 hypothetical protein [Bacteroidales bacterium]
MGFLDKLRKIDKFWIGIVAGLVIPIVLYLIIQPLKAANYSFMQEEYKQAVLKMLPMLLSRCIFPNALLFFILIWSDFEQAAKGILYSTVGLVGILILIWLVF